MPEKEFNLLYEPWIMVMCPDGEIEEVSLLEVFHRAPQWRGLAGELPTQDVAVLRLLLAVLHAVFARYDLEGTLAPISSPDIALQRWKYLWNRESFPMDIIEKYLKHYEDRFYLFHPEYPFYQVPNLDKNKKSANYTVSKMIGEIWQSGSDPDKPQKVRLFPQRTGNKQRSICFSEATRWLLHINAFDDVSGSGKGKGETKRLKYELGWLGQLGLITAVGSNLFETILLNLVFLKDGGNECWGNEKPVWEEPVKDNQGISVLLPDNPSELLTFQSRRLLLKCDGDSVTGYYLLGGDYFLKENAFAEQMSVWRNAAKDSEQPEYSPRRHDPARLLWRDFSALVAQTEGRHRPGVVSWLSRLKIENVIGKHRFNFQTVAVKYNDTGMKNMVVEDLFSDAISINANLLTALGDDWVNAIINEIEVTEKLVEQVGWLAQKLAKAAGDTDGKGQKNAAREQAYFRLDIPFRHWLAETDPERDSINETCEHWWEQSRGIIRDLGGELVYQAGPQAFVGHIIQEKEKGKFIERRYTASEADNYFQYKISSREALI